MSSGQAAKRVVGALPVLQGVRSHAKSRYSSLHSFNSATRSHPTTTTTTFPCQLQGRLYYDYAIHRQQTPPPPLAYRKTLPLFDFFAETNVKPAPSYQFSYGATGFAKRGRPLIESNDEYRSIQVGEDAYFCRADAIGVADGVGGWLGTHGKLKILLATRFFP